MKKMISNNGKGDRVEVHIIVQSAHMAQSDGEVPDPYDDPSAHSTPRNLACSWPDVVPVEPTAVQ